MSRILKLYHKVRRQFLQLPNIVGVSVGLKEVAGKVENELSIKFYVQKKLDAEKIKKPLVVIPRSIDGAKTDVVEREFSCLTELLPPLEDVTPESQEQECTEKRCEIWRPTPGGVSISHYTVTAGTLACWIWMKNRNTPMALSNWHVLAGSNEAQKGDRIYQPGTYDIKRKNLEWSKCVWGELYFYVPIKFRGVKNGGCPITHGEVSLHNWLADILGRKTWVMAEPKNRVDLAVAVPNSDVGAVLEIIDTGIVTGVFNETRPEKLIGIEVQKSGRTTCVTRGIVTDYPLTLYVNYGYYRLATFENQIAFRSPREEKVIGGGDSGSLLGTRSDNEATGLCFAGSSDGLMGVANHIDDILKYGIHFEW